MTGTALPYLSASDFHQTTSVPRLYHILRHDPELVCAAIRFRNSRLRFLPSYCRLDHGRRRFCLDGGAVIPGAETGFHLLFECTYLPSSFLRRRTTLLDAIAVDLGLHIALPAVDKLSYICWWATSGYPAPPSSGSY